MKSNFFLSSYYSRNLQSYTSGPSIDFYDYLKENPKITNLVFFRFPLIDNRKLKYLIIEGKINNKYFFEKKKIFNIFTVKNDYHSTIPSILYKIIECVYLLSYFYKYSKKISFYYVLGTESSQTVCLSLFKILKHRVLIYDVVDFSPRRYIQRTKNFLFHLLDYIACNVSDLNLIQTVRIKNFRKKKFKNKNLKQFVKRSAINKKYFIKNFDNYRKNSIVYAGIISKTEGLEEMIESIGILKKEFPNIKLDIIGRTDDRKYYKFLKKLIKKHRCEKSIYFLGPIHDKILLTKKLSSYSLAIALYKSKLDNFISCKFWNDVNKIRVYNSASLPILMTKIPYSHYEISKENAGFVIAPNNRLQIQDSIRKFFLLTAKKQKEMRKNSYKLAKKYEWSKIFDKLFKKLQHL